MCTKQRVVVVVKGGLVQDVLTEHPSDVLVLDMDIQGADENEIRKCEIYRNREPHEAAPGYHEAIWDPYGVKVLFDEAK